MRKSAQFAALAMAGLTIFTAVARAQALPPAMKAKVEAKAKQFESWSTDPTIVAAVKAHNAAPPAEAKGMTQDKWKSLSDTDPIVSSFVKNSLGVYLKGKQDRSISECFVSGSDGTKVAFLSKTTNWSHSDKDKHKVPMTGKTFIGPPQVDESSKTVEVQIGLPVLDNGKPIGSIVIGIGVTKL